MAGRSPVSFFLPFGGKFQAAWTPPVTMNLGAKNFASGVFWGLFYGFIQNYYFRILFNTIFPIFYIYDFSIFSQKIQNQLRITQILQLPEAFRCFPGFFVQFQREVVQRWDKTGSFE
jgi:hypothetical protein